MGIFAIDNNTVRWPLRFVQLRGTRIVDSIWWSSRVLKSSYGSALLSSFLLNSLVIKYEMLIFAACKQLSIVFLWTND